MPGLFDGIPASDDIICILDQMERNCPKPSSESKKLWDLRCATDICDDNDYKETILEKSVAMLASKGYMPGWFNQCPTASGIGGSHCGRRRDVDLVHWQDSDSPLRLIELKWNSDSPTIAIRQILGYGAAYLFCRMYRNRLPVRARRAMSATHVALRVVAPAQFYRNDPNFRSCLLRARKSLGGVPKRTKLANLSMSIDTLAFPKGFNCLPFTNDAEVKASCNSANLTAKGRIIVDAFDSLASV